MSVSHPSLEKLVILRALPLIHRPPLRSSNPAPAKTAITLAIGVVRRRAIARGLGRRGKNRIGLRRYDRLRGRINRYLHKVRLDLDYPTPLELEKAFRRTSCKLDRILVGDIQKQGTRHTRSGKRRMASTRCRELPARGRPSWRTYHWRT